MTDVLTYDIKTKKVSKRAQTKQEKQAHNNLKSDAKLVIWKEQMAELSKVVPRYLEELKDNNPDLVLSDFQQKKYEEKKALRAKKPE